MTAPTTSSSKAKKDKTITVVQTGSRYGHKPGMLETLKGLGLGRVKAKSELEDTPAIRGMIFKVRHLVRVEEKGN